MSQKTKRIFTACCFSDAVLDDVESVIDSLAPLCSNMKRVRRDQIHVTMHFFSQLTDAEIEKVVDSYRAELAVVPPIPFSIQSVGVFPSFKKPRVLWLGIDVADNAFDTLKRSLDVRLMRAGIPTEKRSFKPHVTIGRFKPKKKSLLIDPSIENIKIDPIMTTCTELCVIESTLTQSAPVYTTHECLLLGGAV